MGHAINSVLGNYTTGLVKKNTMARIKKFGIYGDSFDRIVNRLADHWEQCNAVSKKEGKEEKG